MTLRVMVEMRVTPQMDLLNRASLDAHMQALGLEPDAECEPVPMNEQGSGAQSQPASVIITGTVASDEALQKLERQPGVIAVWRDTPIAPFGG